MQLAEATPGVTPLTRHTWGCQQFISRLAHSETRMQRHLRQAGRQAFDQPALEVNSSDRMHRLGEDAQEAFASGNPDTLNRTGDEMMQVLVSALRARSSLQCTADSAAPTPALLQHCRSDMRHGANAAASPCRAC